MSIKTRYRPALRWAWEIVALTLLASPPALAQISPAAMQAGILVDAYVAQAAQRFGIPEHWIWSVIRIESAGRIRATSSAGAMGLMQLMPATWGVLRDRYGLGTDPYDAQDNIMAGAAYLREMHDRYGSTGMLAAYNAGPGRYEEYLLRGRPLPSETIAYIAKLTPMIGNRNAVLSASPLPATRSHWTQAALFALQTARPDSGPETDGTDAGQPQIETTSAAPSTPKRTLLNVPSTGLFVPLSARRRP